MGYEAMREETFSRQNEMGIVPADTELPPINPIGTSETRQGPEGQPFPPTGRDPGGGVAFGCRRSGCSAGWRRCMRGSSPMPTTRSADCSTTSRRPGSGRTRSSLWSRQGASGEGGPDGSVNEMLFMNGIPDDIETNLAMLDDLGGPKTDNHYPNGWAIAFNTPFKMWSGTSSRGTSDPCLISWPAGMKGARRERGHQYHHAVDLTPTVLDALGVAGSGHDQGLHPEPLRRRQHAVQLRRARRAGCPAHAVLLDARLPGDLARRVEGRDHPPDWSAAGGRWRRISGSFTTPTSTVLSRITSRLEYPDKAPGDGEPLVCGGRRERRFPAR